MCTWGGNEPPKKLGLWDMLESSYPTPQEKPYEKPESIWVTVLFLAVVAAATYLTLVLNR